MGPKGKCQEKEHWTWSLGLGADASSAVLALCPGQDLPSCPPCPGLHVGMMILRPLARAGVEVTVQMVGPQVGGERLVTLFGRHHDLRGHHDADTVAWGGWGKGVRLPGGRAHPQTQAGCEPLPPSTGPQEYL